MCGASHAVKVTREALRGRLYSIATVDSLNTTSPAKLGALHLPGESVETCVYCLRDGQDVVLLNLPAWLRRKHKLAQVVQATFRRASRFYRDDILDFDDGKRTQFREFAHRGILLHVGAMNTFDDFAAEAVENAFGQCAASSRERIEA
jgi:hypothetical protein